MDSDDLPIFNTCDVPFVLFFHPSLGCSSFWVIYQCIVTRLKISQPSINLLSTFGMVAVPRINGCYDPRWAGGWTSTKFMTCWVMLDAIRDFSNHANNGTSWLEQKQKSSGVDIFHDSLLFVHQFTLPKYSQSSDVIVTVPVPLTRKERDLVNPLIIYIIIHIIYNICM